MNVNLHYDIGAVIRNKCIFMVLPAEPGVDPAYTTESCDNTALFLYALSLNYNKQKKGGLETTLSFVYIYSTS